MPTPSRCSVRPWLVAVAVAAVAHTAAGATEFHPLSDKDVKLRTQSLAPDVRLEVDALRYILTPGELADLLADPSSDGCRDWIDRYWKDRDPICTTEVNEAREEFELRVRAALESFRISDWPGWDQRGEFFIRYGRPSGVNRVPPDVSSTSYIPPYEYWYYASLGMLVRFEDPNQSGNFRYVLEDVHLPPAARPRNDRRVMASKELLNLHMDFMTVESSYYQTPELNNFSWQIAGDQYEKLLFNSQEVLKKTPGTFSFQDPGCRVPTVTRMLSFRGGPAIDRVDVNTEYHADVAQHADSAATRRYVTTAVVWDVNGREIARRSQTTTLRTVPGVADTACTVVSQILFPLRPTFYHVGVTVQETKTHRFTSSRQDLSCWDFEQRLAMSDICLASHIGPARDGSAFNRGAFEVVPHPEGRYRPGGKVPLYFEVYNLVPDRRGRYRYTVEYSISPRTPRPQGFWKSLVSSGHEDPTRVVSRFNFTAPGDHDVVHVLVNTEDLWEGEYALNVAVEDNVSSSRVNREVAFRLGGGR